MNRLVIIGTSLLALASIFLLFRLLGSGSLSFANHENEIESRNPFEFYWKPDDTGGKWILNVRPSKFESFLLIKKISPSFDLIVPPQIISSNDPRLHSSAHFSELVNFSVSSNSAYARTESVERQSPVVLATPLNGCGVVVQYGGNVESNSKATHNEVDGMRNAVDIKAKKGTPVIAVTGGTVVYTEDRYPDSGNYSEMKRYQDNRVIVLTDDGFEIVYAHLMKSSILVKEGDRVEVGSAIASVGSSGYSGNPHLHLHIGALTLDGYKTLPVKFLQKDGVVVPAVGSQLCK